MNKKIMQTKWWKITHISALHILSINSPTCIATPQVMGVYQN